MMGIDVSAGGVGIDVSAKPGFEGTMGIDVSAYLTASIVYRDYKFIEQVLHPLLCKHLKPCIAC